MLVNEPVVVEILKRLRNKSLSRHEAAHAIGSILAAQVYNVLKRDQPDAGKTPAITYQPSPRQVRRSSPSGRRIKKTRDRKR